MTKKKVIRNFGGWKSEMFSGKGKIFEISKRILQFFENMGEIWNMGGMHHGVRGDAPACIIRVHALCV